MGDGGQFYVSEGMEIGDNVDIVREWDVEGQFIDSEEMRDREEQCYNSGNRI